MSTGQHIAASSIATSVAVDPRALVVLVAVLVLVLVLIIEPGAAWMHVT